MNSVRPSAASRCLGPEKNELVDIYPTLIDLAGLPPVNDLEGKSLKPVILDFARVVKAAAFSQYPRGRRMGYSVRTDRWRYTEWIDGKTNQTVARELYDHRSTQIESNNVAQEQSNMAHVRQLPTLLREHIDIQRD